VLSYFRINDPYRLVGLLVIMTLLTLPLFIDTPDVTVTELKSFVVGERVSNGHSLYHETIDSTPPLTAWFYGLFDMVFGRSLTARHIFAFLILFFQSAFLGIILIDKKVFSENTYIPSLLFSLLAFISFDSLALTGDLLAFGVILLALNNLIKEIEFRTPRDETTFNLGIFISIASMFSFSYAIYLPGAIILLSIFTRSSVRKYLLLAFGFLLPHVVLICIYNLNGHAGELWQNYYLHNLSFPSHDLISTTSLLLLCTMPLFYLFVSLFILNRDARLTKYQSQIFQAMFLWFVIAFVQFFITADFRPQSIITVIPSVSFFLTHFLLLIRRRKFAEMNTLILLVGIVTVAYLTRYNQIPQISYTDLFVQGNSLPVKNKKILVLSAQHTVFRDNELGSSFYDWDLSERVFRNPDYYENLLMVHRAFEKEKPEVIVDPENLMAGFFSRLPQLRAQYSKSSEGYQLKKISN
jgi:hypothetical protein